MEKAYGTLEYFKQKKEVAELTVNLVREAVAARLQKGIVSPDELRIYSDIIEMEEGMAKYERNEYDKARERLNPRDHAVSTAQSMNETR